MKTGKRGGVTPVLPFNIWERRGFSPFYREERDGSRSDPEKRAKREGLLYPFHRLRQGRLDSHVEDEGEKAVWERKVKKKEKRGEAFLSFEKRVGME